MKLRFNLTPSILALALCLTTAPLKAMDEYLTIQNNFDMDSIFSSTTVPHTLKVAHPELFSPKELTDMEIGYALIEQRIQMKKKIISYLTDGEISLEGKAFLCGSDFGIIPFVGPLSAETAVEKGIEGYTHYLSSLVSVYALAQDNAHRLLASTTAQEKHLHQNNIYYILSFEIKNFRECMTKNYTHIIPEHSLEDNFYAMICSKMCATATKEYDILSDYLILTLTKHGMTKQIDNQRLLDNYQSTHQHLIDSLQTCPAFMLESVDTKITKVNTEISALANPYFESVNARIKECGIQRVAISDRFAEQLETYNAQHVVDHSNDLTTMYLTCGPWLLAAIHDYEAISITIKEIEKEAIQWVRNFKSTKSRLFRKLPTDFKRSVDTYLQTKATIEKEEKERIVLIKKQEAECKARERIAKKKIRHAEIKKREAENNRAEMETMQRKRSEEEKTDLPSSEVASSPVKTLTHVETKQPVVIPESQPIKSTGGDLLSSLPEQPVPMLNATPHKSLSNLTSEPEIAKPKIKVKTRPVPPAVDVVEDTPEKEDFSVKKLPAQYQTFEFISFVKDLCQEKKENKLKKLFKELNSVYGVMTETEEKNNKGYFAVRSPITGQMHVRTYHHLHVDHPYASIFMAVREVLIAADIIER